MKNLKNEKSKMNTCAPLLRSRVEIVAFHLLHNKATWEAFDKWPCLAPPQEMLILLVCVGPGITVALFFPALLRYTWQIKIVYI